MTTEPRSVSEALAAVDREREEAVGTPEHTDGAEPVEETSGGGLSDQLSLSAEAGAPEHVEEEPVEAAGTPDELRAFLVGGTASDELSDATPEPGDSSSGGLPLDPPSPPVEDVGHDPHLEQGDSPLPADRAPTMGDLRAVLLSPGVAADYSTPDEFGPWVDYGNTRIPLVLLRLAQRGVIKGWQ